MIEKDSFIESSTLFKLLTEKKRVEMVKGNMTEASMLQLLHDKQRSFPSKQEVLRWGCSTINITHLPASPEPQLCAWEV